jgi:hypothetical protein
MASGLHPKQGGREEKNAYDVISGRRKPAVFWREDLGSELYIHQNLNLSFATVTHVTRRQRGNDT